MANYTTEEITQALNKAREHFDHGGRYLAAVRSWMQRTFINGDRVTWGGNEYLTGTTLTPFEMEQLATIIMDATVAEMKQHVLSELQDIQMIKDIRTGTNP